MRMCAIRLDEACDMNMDTGAGSATRECKPNSRRVGGGKASIADKQRNVCNVLWQLIMRATGFLICATALWQVVGEELGKVNMEWGESRRRVKGRGMKSRQYKVVKMEE